LQVAKLQLHDTHTIRRGKEVSEKRREEELTERGWGCWGATLRYKARETVEVKMDG